MPVRVVHAVCLGLREGDREDHHPLDEESKRCTAGHAWCGECLVDDHSLTCDVCDRLNCPECTRYDAFGEPIRRFIPCLDCIQSGVEDGGMQVCDRCFDEVKTYGCCARALGHTSCPEHAAVPTFCVCGTLVCEDCAAADHCECGDFHPAVVAIVVDE